MESGRTVSEALLQVSLEAGYKGTKVLDGLSFQLEPADRLGLLGPSGSGKSTLLLSLLGLLPQRGGWVRGEVRLRGQNLLAMRPRDVRQVRGKEIALVPQSPAAALNPALSLGKHFEAAWSAHRKRDRVALQARLEMLLRRVALPTDAEFLSRRPGQISVGQAQRCALALALLHGPSILIADEPTSALDPVSQTEVLSLLRGVCKENGTALLFVSHDLLSVLRLCESVAVLSRGQIAERMCVEDVVLGQDPELRRLLACLPIPPEVLLEHTRAERESNRMQLKQDTTYA